VLLGFAAGSRVLDGPTTALATAIVALSMALTPFALLAFEKLVLQRAVERPEPERLAFDERAPDAIVAGFGRFGQIATRLLMANGFSVVLLDNSIEQIDLIRRFGWRVHYGDASRLDLLRTAGADKAKLLVVAVDDRNKAKELVELAKQAFPHLQVIARAFDRRHAYELLDAGADAVERETYESALNFGRTALEALGLGARRALKAAVLFREHDTELFHRLRPVAPDSDQYVLASRASRETFEKLIGAEMERLTDEDEDEAAPRATAAE
jgi:voltage-gated potassium channel Kch